MFIIYISILCLLYTNYYNNKKHIHSIIHFVRFLWVLQQTRDFLYYL